MIDLLEAMAASARSADAHDGRIPYLLYGTVTSVENGGQYRVRARFGAMEAGTESAWLLPLAPGGIESQPRVDEPVIVGFVDGDPGRGVYWYYPKSTTKNRPTEAMALGNTWLAMYNHLAQLANDLKSKLNSLITKYNTHTHTYTYGTTGPTDAIDTTLATADAGKGKKGDGSTAGDDSGSKIVLSSIAKVR